MLSSAKITSKLKHWTVFQTLNCL